MIGVRFLRLCWLVAIVMACLGCSSSGNGVSDCPIADGLHYSVFSGAPLSADLGSQDVSSCRLSSQPKLGEVTSLDESTGAFTYVSQLDVVGSDSFELEVQTGSAGSGTCRITIEIEPMNFTELWATREVSVLLDGVDQGACQDGTFEILHSDTALELADRLHDCESSDATHNEIAFTLDDGAISYQETEIGHVGPSSIQYDHCLGSTCFSLEITRVHGQELFDYHETFSGSGIEAESTARLRPTGARLIAVDGDNYYLRDASPFGIPAEQTILLKNLGTSTALNIAGNFDNELFYFKAEAFPGEGGTCETTLDPGQECTLVVEFQPVWYTTRSGDLTLSYENLLGQAELILHLTGSAKTEFEITGDAADQLFGFRVAGSGQAVAASAGDSLFLYRKTTDEWFEERVFTPGPIMDIDLEGDLLICGYTDVDGAVDIYRYSGSDWVIEDTLTSGDTLDGFGGKVAISGDNALVALTVIDAVNAFQFDGSSWQFVEQLTSTAGTSFGSNLAVDDTTAIIASTAGADGDGSVAIYEFDGASWQLLQPLTVDDSTIDSHVESYGGGVDIDGDWAIVSGYEFARGTRAFIFHRDAGNWTQAMKFGSGYADFSDGDRVAIELPWMVSGQLGSFNDNGHTFTLKLVEGEWQQAMQVPTGFALDAAENFIVTGEPYENIQGIGSDVGMVRIYD